MGFAGKIVCPYPQVIVGVSGGVDSMTLADMLHRQGSVEFAVAHCNFHLRGRKVMLMQNSYATGVRRTG